MNEQEEEKAEEIVDDDHQQQLYGSFFPKLNAVEIFHCDQLKFIFPFSYVPALPSLESIIVQESSQMKYMFGPYSDKDNLLHQKDKEIVLPVCSQLNLYNLPNFIGIFPENCHPTLSSSSLDDGPETRQLEIVTSSGSQISNSKEFGQLKQLLTFRNIRNVRIIKCQKLTSLFTSPMETMLLEKLTIMECDALKHIIENGSFFPKLKHLDVQNCKLLEFIFPAAFSGNLASLERITKKYASQDLGKIFEEEAIQNGSKPHNQQVCFSSLAVVIVRHCDNLKHLFPISTDSAFPELKLLFVDGNLNLKQVFACEQGGTNKRVQVVLPKLKYLVLKELRGLINNDSLGIQLQPVEYCIMQGCPQLTLSSTTTSQKLLNHFLQLHEDFQVSDLVRLLIDDCEDMEPKNEQMVQSDEDSENDTSILRDVETQVEEASESEMPSSEPQDMKGSVEEAPASNASKIRAPSNDSEPGSPVSVPLTSPLRKSSAQSIEGREEEIVEKSPASEKPTPTTLAFSLGETSHDVVDGHSLSEPILKNQQQQAHEETQITTGIPRRITTIPSETIVENVEEGPTLENAKISSSSIHSEPRSSKQDPLVTHLHETSPKEFLVKEPANKQTDVEQALEENKRTHQITPKEDKPSDLQHMQGPSNVKKTSLQISSTIPELKGSALTSVVAFPKRISPLISSIPKMNTASPPSSSSGLILQPKVLQELKTELDAYLNMSLEAIFESNDFDNVERIVNSLATGTADIIQRNILEDLATRFKNFKECIPQAMNIKQSSFEFMSNYENLSMELNTKLSKGQGKVRDLESRFSETCEEEYAIEIEIQKLIARRFEILAQKNSLASQLDQSAQEVSKDYEEWKALGKELKLSTDQWLKSKEVLAHANASWSVFKESLRL